MRSPLGKYPGMLVAAVVTAALLVWGLWPQPVPVEAVAAKRAPLRVTIEEEGMTRVIDRFVITAPVAGVAGRITLKAGDPIEKGQTLVSLTPPESRILDPRSQAEAEARISAATASLASARQQADSAAATAKFQQLEVKRLRPLGEKGVVSREALDRADMQQRTADAALSAAQHAVDVARYELEAVETALRYAAGAATPEAGDRVPVRSPIDGRVLKVAHEWEGPVVTGETLLEVGDPKRLEVAVDVLSADAVKISPGMPVRFERWGGAEPLEGVVRTVEPMGFTKVSALGVEEQRVWIIADFTSPPELWQRLGDGYRVDAHFVLWYGDDVLQVPASSLFRHKDGWAVFVVENGRAQRREVSVGQRNALYAQILDGVAEGGKVIDHPSDSVEDGVRVAGRGE